MTFKRGIIVGLPVCLGYIPIAIAYGLLGMSFEIPGFIILLLSIIVFAGASQFIGIGLIGVGASPFEIIFTTFMVNIRHLLMSASLEKRVDKKTPLLYRSIIAFGITDETFSLLSFQNANRMNYKFIIGVNTIAYSSWVFGTLIGISIGNIIPESLALAMNFSLYAMFIALLVPAAKKSIKIASISVLSAGLHIVIRFIFPGLSIGWSIVLATVIASGTGVFIFKEEDHNEC